MNLAFMNSNVTHNDGFTPHDHDVYLKAVENCKYPGKDSCVLIDSEQSKQPS